MGIKIKNAWNKELKRFVHISEATDEMRKNKELVCHPHKCNAKLTWAERHKVNYKLNTKFYRLLQNELHQPNCHNSPIGQVHEIAKHSDNKILENIKNDKFEFRLNLVFESKRNEKSSTASEIKSSYQSDSLNKERIIKTKGKKSPYISTMRDVMKLRSEVENNDELSSIIKLKFGGNSIPWENFYFELEEEEKCFRQIESNGIKYNDRIYLNHLICSEFMLKEENITNNNNIFTLNATPRFVTPNPQNESHIYKVVLRTKDSTIISHITETFEGSNNNMVFAGFFKANIKTTPYSYKTKSGIKVFNHDIEGWINANEQVIVVNRFC